MSKYPLVSVVMATYNMAQYVGTAIDSILNQDYPSVEVVVIDDGSTDNTPEVLARYSEIANVRTISQENAGQTAAKNRGVAEAKGEFVGFCDADNAWLHDKLSSQVPAFQCDNPPGVVYGDIRLMDDLGKELPTPSVKRPSGHITGKLLANNFVPFNTCLVPRRVLEEVGGFDESLSMAIDYDLWLRISVKYEFLHLPRVMADYRIWGGQMSHRTGERLDNAIRMMQKFLTQYPGAVTSGEARHAWAYTYTTRGLWHAREGRRSLAMFDYQKALENNIWEKRAWKSLIRLALGI